MSQSGKTFALVDCNSFYASCEKLFRPDLKDRPVVVLSNNDGCIVARSPEAKALGLKMAAPRFKMDSILKEHDVAVFSSNYALYADISERVMTTLESLAPEVEVYSIDEAFLDLDNLSHIESLTEYGQLIRNTVTKNVGIGVGVGIGPTKTLAKLANYAAKHYKATQGVVDLTDPIRQQKLMSITPVGEVWGVGRKIGHRLNDMGISTVLELANADKQMVRQRFSVVLEQTVRELNGESCLSLESVAPKKQQIVCSRSFGKRVTTQVDMAQAVSGYAVRATEKLRGEQQQAGVLNIFIRTSPFASNKPQYANSRSIKLPFATNDSRLISHYAKKLLNQIWKDGYEYAKAGVMLSDFSPETTGQEDIFYQVQSDKRQKLMQLLDEVNKRARGKLKLASETGSDGWQMSRNHLSPQYTTNWQELPRVR